MNYKGNKWARTIRICENAQKLTMLAYNPEKNHVRTKIYTGQPPGDFRRSEGPTSASAVLLVGATISVVGVTAESIADVDIPGQR